MESSTAAEKEVQSTWPKNTDSFHNKINKLKIESQVKYQRVTPYLLGAVDAIALFSSLILGKLAYWQFFQEEINTGQPLEFGPVWAQHSLLFYGLIPISLIWFWSAGHYSKRRPLWDEVREAAKILLFLGFFDAALVFLVKWPVSRLWLGMTWTFALLLVPLLRIALKEMLLVLGGWRRPTVVVGVGENARRTADAMLSERLMGYSIIAFVAGPSHAAKTETSISIGSQQIPVLYYSSRLWELLKSLNSPHLVVALEKGEEEQQRQLFSAIGEGYRNLHIAPPVTGLPLYGTEVERFFRHEVLLLRVQNNLARLWAQFAKRVFDLVVASILIVLCLPVFLLVAISIKLEDGGPIFYTQERVGRRGRIFKVLKFRSMTVNSHQVLLQWLQENPEIKKEYEENNNKLRKDPRITKTGCWLRAASIDELPQLWNVINGEMSLVGPRPLLEREVGNYGTNIHLYKQARPGITGIWQISGRSKTQFTDRSNLDAWYIRNWSLWYDFYILIKTAVVVLKRDGAY